MSLSPYPSEDLLADDVADRSVTAKLQRDLPAHLQRDHFGSHCGNTRDDDIRRRRAFRSNRALADCRSERTSKLQCVTLVRRFFQNLQREGAHAPHIDCEVQLRWRPEWMKPTHRVLWENPAINGQQVDAVRIVPTAFVNAIRIFKQIAIRCAPSLLSSRFLVVEVPCLIDSKFEPAQEAQHIAPLVQEPIPGWPEFLEVAAQLVRQDRHGVAERSVNLRPRISVLTRTLLQRVRYEQATR